jgi:predicted naringenin-chalcone synthase
MAATSSLLRSSPRETALAVAVETCSIDSPTSDDSLAVQRTVPRSADRQTTCPLAKVANISWVACAAEPPDRTGSASRAIIGALWVGLYAVFAVSVLSPDDFS